MNRKDALVHIKFAGYHEDSKTAMRIYIENMSATPLTLTHTRLEGRSRPMACPAVAITASAQHRSSSRFAGPSHQFKENPCRTSLRA